MISLEKMKASLSVYRDRRMLVLLGLGFSSGLPILLVFGTLSLWLAEVDVDVKTIGLISLVMAPYKFKPLWAPLVDRISIPKLGLRRGWLLITQIGLILAMVMLAGTDPGTHIEGTIFWAIVLATISATHDIVVDGFRVEMLEDDEQGAGAAVAVFGYRIGMIVASAGALYVAEFFDWRAAYLTMAACVLLGVLATLFAVEPEGSSERLARREDEDVVQFLGRHLKDGVLSPFGDLLKRRGSILFIVFIMFFSLGDALLSVMTNPFLHDMGFSKLEIANVVKTFGIVTTIIGVFLGGALVRGVGVVKALWIAGILQMLSNFTFSLQAMVGYDLWFLTATIAVEKLATGLGSAAFVAYLSGLCNRSYSATQYALLTSVSGLVRMVLGTISGWAVEQLGWALYFAATAVAAIPGLVLLYFLDRWRMTGLRERESDPTETV